MQVLLIIIELVNRIPVPGKLNIDHFFKLSKSVKIHALTRLDERGFKILLL